MKLIRQNRAKNAGQYTHRLTGQWYLRKQTPLNNILRGRANCFKSFGGSTAGLLISSATNFIWVKTVKSLGVISFATANVQPIYRWLEDNSPLKIIQLPSCRTDKTPFAETTTRHNRLITIAGFCRALILAPAVIQYTLVWRHQSHVAAAADFHRCIAKLFHPF